VPPVPFFGATPPWGGRPKERAGVRCRRPGSKFIVTYIIFI